MSRALSRTMEIRKHVVETSGGVVAAQHRQAAEAGAEALRAGGDAVDAAVACGFVCGVLEPWMSGPRAAVLRCTGALIPAKRTR